MKNMLVLANRLDIESHLSELREIAKTHEIVKVYLARTSPRFGSRVRSIMAPHRLDMVTRMGDEATNKYLSTIAHTLHEGGMECEPIGAGIPEERLDDFIKEHNIDLVLTSDGRTGLCRWAVRGLINTGAQSLYENTFAGDRVELVGQVGTKPYVRNILVMLNRLDIEERLSELKNIIKMQEVEKVYLAGVLGTTSAFARSDMSGLELNPLTRVTVYVARVSRAFGSRIRSIVMPQKLDVAVRMSNAAANKYLATIADALSREGIEAVPIGTGIPVEKVKEYVKKNSIDLIVTADGRSGLSSWPVGRLTVGNLRPIYEYGLMEKPVAFEHSKAGARHGLRAMTGFALQFSALFLFWLVLSGHFTPKYVVLGAASAALVTFLTNDLFSEIFQYQGTEAVTTTQSFRKFLRFLAYMPWLLYQIIKANIQVAKIVLDPKMPINPAILQFSTRLKKGVEQVILATSITLTPGTVVILLEDGMYTVHAIEPGAAGDLVAAKMQNKVADIFLEKPEPPPADARWAHSLEELGS